MSYCQLSKLGVRGLDPAHLFSACTITQKASEDQTTCCSETGNKVQKLKNISSETSNVTPVLQSIPTFANMASFIPCMAARRPKPPGTFPSHATSTLPPSQNGKLLRTIQIAVQNNHLGQVLNILTDNPHVHLPQHTIDELAAKLRMRGLYHRARLIYKRLDHSASLAAQVLTQSLDSPVHELVDQKFDLPHTTLPIGDSICDSDSSTSLHLKSLIDQRKIDEAISFLKKSHTKPVRPALLRSLGAMASADGQIKKAHTVLTDIFPRYGVLPCADDYSHFIKASGRAGSLHRAITLLDTPAFAFLSRKEKSQVMCLVVESCVKSNDLRQADTILSEMRSCSIPIADHVYLSILQASQHAFSLQKKLLILNDIRRDGDSQRILAAYNAILLGAARAARTDDAFNVFETMISDGAVVPNRDTYNNLLVCCAKAGNPDRALRVLDMLKGTSESIQPNAKSYNSVVAACARVGDVDRAFEVARHMSRVGIRLNIVTKNHLLEAYCNAGKLERAFSMTKEMVQSQGIKPNSHTYDILIRGCGRWGQLDAALRLLSSMQTAGVPPTVVTYSVAIDACARAGGPVAVDKAFELLTQMEQAGLEPNVVTFNSLIHACAQGKRVRLAFDVMNHMVRADVTPDMVTLCSLVDACGRAQDLEKAFRLMKILPRKFPGLKPNVPVFNAIMHACSKASDFDRMLQVFQNMKARHMKPSVVTFSTLISAYASIGDVEEALHFMSEMKSYGLKPSRQTYTSVIAAYGRNGEVEKAMSMLNKTRIQFGEPDEELYTAAIVAAVGGGRRELAVQLANEMNDAGYVVPTVLNSIMRKVGDVERSGTELRRVLSAMEALNIRPQRAALESLIATYVKEVNVSAAFGVLPDMERLGYPPNIQTYKKLIQVCALSGERSDIEKARKLFDMVRARVRDNDLLQSKHRWRELYEALLQACGQLSQDDPENVMICKDILDRMARDCGQDYVHRIMERMSLTRDKKVGST